MPDATEWLVEHDDPDDHGSAYEHIAGREDALEYIRQLFAKGETSALLYQLVPFTVTVGVIVARGRRRKKEAKEGSPEKGRSPVDDGGASAGGPVLQTGPDGCQSAEENRATESGDASDGEKDGAPKPEPAPIFPWTCEARFDNDPVCVGPAEMDPVTRGYFCALHGLIPESNRRELHRRHASRNRPVRVAHAG